MRRALALALAVVVAASVVLYARKRSAERDITVSSFTTDSPSRIPMLAVRGTSPSGEAPVALLVHGYQCNKSMMAQLAKHLALNGIDSYAVDLPGHGASPEPHVDDRAAAVAAEALEYLARNERVTKDRVVLIGHSYGAAVAGRLLLLDDAYDVAVLLGPGSAPDLSPTLPRRLLVVTGEHDYDFVVRYARHIIADTAAGAVRGVASAGHSGHDRWRVIPGVGHVGLLLSPVAHDEVLVWLAGSGAIELSADRRPATYETIALAVLVPAALALLALVVAAPPRVRPTWPSLRAVLTLGCAWGIALLAVRYVVPLAIFRIREGELLASVILLAGLVATVLDISVSRGAHLPPLRDAARGLPVAVTAVAALYVCAAAFIEHDLYHLLLSPERAAIAVALAVMLFPFFAVCEGVFPACGRQRVLVVCLVYSVAALTVWTLQVRLERFGPALFGLGVLSAVLGGVVRRISTSGSAAAFSALTAGWIFAVGFIRY